MKSSTSPASVNTELAPIKKEKMKMPSLPKTKIGRAWLGTGIMHALGVFFVMASSNAIGDISDVLAFAAGVVHTLAFLSQGSLFMDWVSEGE